MAILEQLELRVAAETDLIQVCAIEEASFSSAWSLDFFRHELHNPVSRFFVAAHENQVVGYVVFWVVADQAHIANIAVHPDFRRQGIGDFLCQVACETARESGAVSITLEVNENNHPAIELYQRMNFRMVGRRKKYYENRDDALILTRVLN